MDVAVAVLGFTPASLFGYRAVAPGFVTPPAIETIFTSMFLHGSILHIAGNMLYLWIFGNNVEDAMGHFRFVFFYLVVAELRAALTLAYVDPASRLPMVGASGRDVSGVLAGYVLLFPRARVTVIVPLGIYLFYPFTVSAFWVVGFWFVLQLVSAAFSNPNQPGVAWWAHVGGFAAGLLLTPILKSADFPLFGRVRPREALGGGNSRFRHGDLARVSLSRPANGPETAYSIGSERDARDETTQKPAISTGGVLEQASPWSRPSRSGRHRSPRHQAHAVPCVHPGLVRSGARRVSTRRNMAVRPLRLRTPKAPAFSEHGKHRAAIPSSRC